MQFCTLNKLKKGKFDTDLNCQNIKKIKKIVTYDYFKNQFLLPSFEEHQKCFYFENYVIKNFEGFPQLHQNMVTLANVDINNNESESENTGIDSNSNIADESHE